MRAAPSILAANCCLQGARGWTARICRSPSRPRRCSRLVFAIARRPRAALPLPSCRRCGSSLAHSANFTFNCQVWVGARYCASYRRDPRALERFSGWTAPPCAGRRWLAEAALIGSRGGGAQGFGPRSDLDLRLIFPPGPLAWVRTNLLLLRLRTAAFLRAIPLDLYAYDTPEALRRFDQRERLLLILDRQGRLAAAFPERVAR
jgi:hypothetical protein